MDEILANWKLQSIKDDVKLDGGLTVLNTSR